MEKAVTKERVEERASRLYECGYRAAALPGAPDGIYIVITPGGDAYTCDKVAASCDCEFFPRNGFCKHSLGLPALIRAQKSARKVRQKFIAAAQAGEPLPASHYPLPSAEDRAAEREQDRIYHAEQLEQEIQRYAQPDRAA